MLLLTAGVILNQMPSADRTFVTYRDPMIRAGLEALVPLLFIDLILPLGFKESLSMSFIYMSKGVDALWRAWSPCEGLPQQAHGMDGTLVSISRQPKQQANDSCDGNALVNPRRLQETSPCPSTWCTSALF